MEETLQPEKKPAVGAMAFPGRWDQARLFLGVFCLAAVLWAVSAQAADPARVRGYVYETEPGVVVLESDNGILYTLKGQGLDAHIETTVDAVGDVSTDVSGNIYLSVRSLRSSQGSLEFGAEDVPVRR